MEAFYRALASRLLLPPSLPKGLMILPVNSPSAKEVGHGSLSSPPVPACQPDPSLPAQRARLCSAAAVLQPSLHQGKDYLPDYFSFLFKRADVKAGSPSFLVSHLLLVESSLIGVGNGNNKKQAHNSNMIYPPQPSRH